MRWMNSERKRGRAKECFLPSGAEVKHQQQNYSHNSNLSKYIVKDCLANAINNREVRSYTMRYESHTHTLSSAKWEWMMSIEHNVKINETQIKRKKLIKRSWGFENITRCRIVEMRIKNALPWVLVSPSHQLRSIENICGDENWSITIIKVPFSLRSCRNEFTSIWFDFF